MKKRVNQHTVLPMPQRFMDKVTICENSCWEWTGSKNGLGYGQFPFEGENKAHRVAFRLFVGPITDGLYVLHKCDNRSCVNPSHLFLGTQSDNIHDMMDKGRHVVTRSCGDSNGMAKLTQEQVAAIRSAVSAGATQRSLCKPYGVSPMTISRIVRRESWI